MNTHPPSEVLGTQEPGHQGPLWVWGWLGHLPGETAPERVSLSPRRRTQGRGAVRTLPFTLSSLSHVLLAVRGHFSFSCCVFLFFALNFLQ